jgi:hypothetical protein
VDGKLIGDTPQNSIVLTVGTHTVEVKRPGYRPASREIEIREGQIAQYTVSLVPEAAP